MDQRLYELGADGLEEITPDAITLADDSSALQGLWGLTVATVLLPLLALIIIFL